VPYPSVALIMTQYLNIRKHKIGHYYHQNVNILPHDSADTGSRHFFAWSLKFLHSSASCMACWYTSQWHTSFTGIVALGQTITFSQLAGTGVALLVSWYLLLHYDGILVLFVMSSNISSVSWFLAIFSKFIFFSTL
jgi:hypothetical protein